MIDSCVLRVIGWAVLMRRLHFLVAVLCRLSPDVLT